MICEILTKIFKCNSRSEDEPFQDSDPLWLDYAYKELGVSEISGSGNNKKIIEYHLETSLKASDDETPWCSSFVNWCIKQAGKKGTNSAMARSWMLWGQGIIEPTRGCIVVLWRGSRSSAWGHVGFYIKRDKKYIYILGGNVNNKVMIQKYHKDRTLGFRIPE